MDLVQSVHRSLLLGLRQDKFAVDAPENLMALALTLVRRKAARQWRRVQRQKRMDGGSKTEGTLAGFLISLGSAEPDPAQAVQWTEQVHNLCSGLNDQERRMLEMRMQGNTPAEMSRELGLSAVAYRVRLTRLRQHLRDAGVLDEFL